MMKTAYFHPSQLCRIDAEYRALRLESDEKAPRFLPIRLLERIVCQGQIDWSSQALALCLQHRVVVQFIDGNGELKGSLQAAGARPQGSQSASDWLPRLEGLSARLTDWGIARERQQLLVFSRQCFGHSQAASCGDKSWQTVQHALQARHRQSDVAAQDQQVMAWLAAWIDHELNQAGFIAQESLIVTQLAEQLQRILRWPLRAEYGEWLTALETGDTLAALFEQQQTRLFNHLRRELDELQQWVNEESPFEP